MSRTVLSRLPLVVAAAVATFALVGCSSEPLPRDAGSGDGSGYGVPQK